MNIPNLQPGKAVTEDGSWHPNTKGWFDVITTQLQKNLSNEGFMIPQQPTKTIDQLNTKTSIGALLYDNETHQLKVNINGEFKVVTVT